MSAAYQHLALAEVAPGMVLSDNLLDRQGQILLPKGAILTDRTIALLPSHGIDAVPVLRSGAAPPAACAPDHAASVQRLAVLFRKHKPEEPHDWATSALRRYIEDYRAAREAAL
ncbi:hypothetical protein INH39_06160 [Massilia violaceinigra]|uniref:Uncharacterized protein n=1 Tax=Massilia violaceinigra TaxID=2045208 RepID=A0ABY4A903_9BURK|nr:hypothetical protein [Massilia violaceinigra]UOD31295.1 hypothetical protein INH39_06160 [Massilia violaceinigra]